MLPRRAKPVRNPNSAYFERRNFPALKPAAFALLDLVDRVETLLIDLEDATASLTAEDIANTPTVVIADEGAGEHDPEVSAHLGRLQ